MDEKVVDSELEQRWVRQAKYDVQAFEQLYERYYPRLYAYASYRLGRAQDAEDVVAETFLKMIEKIEQLTWASNHQFTFAAWVFRIAHNLINDFYRRTQGHPEALSLDDVPNLEANTLLPDSVIVRKELFSQLWQLISTLSPRRQEVITLKFFGGLRNKVVSLNCLD